MNPTTSRTFAVLGAGLAAGKAVEKLRDSGFDGRIVLYGQEPHRPYERPPLSKGYLMGNEELGSAFVHPATWYGEHHVELRLGTTVTALDPAQRDLLVGKRRESYDKLLIATGAVPRHLPMADRSGAPVTYLRTIEDADRIKSVLREGARLAIIGGGWIGLEVAAAARSAGAQVTVLESAELPLVRVLGPEVADLFAALHLNHGVDLRVGTTVSGIGGDDEQAVVRLADGSSVEADLVVVGIGVLPSSSLAESAGLRTDNGIVVDERLCTSAPDIFAAGDVANAYHPLLDRHLRVEHWDNAIEQGRTAAQNMLGEAITYDRLPYFFSDQYDLGMEYVGSIGSDGYDRVILRGQPDDGTFTAFWLGHGRVLAAMHANDWDAIEPIRKIVGADRGLERLDDESVPLEEIAANLG